MQLKVTMNSDVVFDYTKDDAHLSGNHKDLLNQRMIRAGWGGGRWQSQQLISILVFWEHISVKHLCLFIYKHRAQQMLSEPLETFVTLLWG